MPFQNRTSLHSAAPTGLASRFVRITDTAHLILIMIIADAVGNPRTCTKPQEDLHISMRHELKIITIVPSLVYSVDPLPTTFSKVISSVLQIPNYA